MRKFGYNGAATASNTTSKQLVVMVYRCKDDIDLFTLLTPKVTTALPQVVSHAKVKRPAQIHPCSHRAEI